MKKLAHTLAEILVALAVIGVVGAVVMPLTNKFKPDVNKIKFLRNYDAIVQVNQHLIYDTDLYPQFVNGRNISDFPLIDNSVVVYDEKNYGGGYNKYCQFLGLFLANEEALNTCSNDYSDEIDGDPHFSSKDGTDYWVYTSIDPVEYRTDIYIDVDGAQNGENCINENDGSCLTPDRFKLHVKSDGDILPGDYMARYYLRTRTNYRLNRDKVIDYEETLIPENTFVINQNGN